MAIVAFRVEPAGGIAPYPAILALVLGGLAVRISMARVEVDATGLTIRPSVTSGAGRS
jgi:hypothetical protein